MIRLTAASRALARLALVLALSACLIALCVAGEAAARMSGAPAEDRAGTTAGVTVLPGTATPTPTPTPSAPTAPPQPGGPDGQSPLPFTGVALLPLLLLAGGLIGAGLLLVRRVRPAG